MANELEGARTIPVKFFDQEDGSEAERVAIVEAGDFGYASGSAAGTIDVPADCRIRSLSVLAGDSGDATITIAGGATITVPSGGGFDDQLRGAVPRGSNVVLGGDVIFYYVSWASN